MNEKSIKILSDFNSMITTLKMKDSYERNAEFKSILTFDDLLKIAKTYKNKKNIFVVKMKLSSESDFRIVRYGLNDDLYISVSCNEGFIATRITSDFNGMMFSVNNIPYIAKENNIRPDGSNGIRIANDNDLKPIRENKKYPYEEKWHDMELDLSYSMKLGNMIKNKGVI